MSRPITPAMNEPTMVVQTQKQSLLCEAAAKTFFRLFTKIKKGKLEIKPLIEKIICAHGHDFGEPVKFLFPQ